MAESGLGTPLRTLLRGAPVPRGADKVQMLLYAETCNIQSQCWIVYSKGAQLILTIGPTTNLEPKWTATMGIYGLCPQWGSMGKAGGEATRM